ncbi:MAG TPA: SDR family NAD(P)-dependent oxidoreductase [Trebonia sp.]|jgi:NAD(P)-dependent dehydrogenase (short-subunit alcohol dehydrogenase family)|nr:SDR family NAD(P)-dependent oxidoreductase [Trebonia sp.]
MTSEQASGWHGKRVLVAGGDGEIGRVICAGLAARGADIAVASIDAEAAEKLAASLATGANRVAAYQADITDQDKAEGLAREIAGQWGGIDVLVNCAGIMRVSPALEFRAPDWRAVVETNLNAAFFISQAVGRVMIAGGGGRMVHLSSVRGTVGLAIGGFVAYGTSKAGLHLMIKQLAAEWGQHQVSVNGVAAGFVRTAMSAGAGEGFQAMVAARTPLGRVAEISEIANATVYLAGPDASFITGQVLAVDGGLTATQ